MLAISDFPKSKSIAVSDIRNSFFSVSQKSPRMDQDDLRAKIQAALDANPNLTKSGLAGALGIVNSGVSSLLKSGGRQIKAHELAKIEKYLGISLTESKNRGASNPPPARLTLPLRVGEMPRDVPIMGNAYGGDEADFCFTQQVTDYGRRPPKIAQDTTVFGVYVSGNSMAPRFTEGELIYASSSRLPAIGEYVIVEVHPATEGGDVLGYVKQLVKRTPTKIVLKQFNPEKTLEFSLNRVKAIHRIIPWTELLGA